MAMNMDYVKDAFRQRKYNAFTAHNLVEDFKEMFYNEDEDNNPMVAMKAYMAIRYLEEYIKETEKLCDEVFIKEGMCQMFLEEYIKRGV